MNRSLATAFSSLLLFVLASSPAVAEDWPQFLGPDRNGVSQETGLIDQWPEGGPKEVWRSECGPGMSGLAIADGRLFTMFQDARRQYVICLNAKTGERIWRTGVAPAYRNGQGDGPRATPTVNGGAVFVFTGQGVLAALDAKNGSIRWSQDALKENGGRDADYGMASSPLVLDNAVVVTVGAASATVIAVERKSGQTLWRAGRGMPAGYSSPTLLELNDKPQIVAFTGSAAIGIQPDDGKLLWSYPFKTSYECNIATPITLADDTLFLSAGENHGSVALELVERDGRLDPVAKWESLGRKSVMRNEWQTSIYHDGHLYGFDNVGGAGPISHLTCIDAASGERKWQEIRYGKGNLILADGKLFLSTVKGELVVARATPSEYQEVGRTSVVGFTRQAPALANGLLYLRDDKVVVCLDVRAAAN